MQFDTFADVFDAHAAGKIGNSASPSLDPLLLYIADARSFRVPQPLICAEWETQLRDASQSPLSIFRTSRRC
jgi:hypothetical protein